MSWATSNKWAHQATSQLAGLNPEGIYTVFLSRI